MISESKNSEDDDPADDGADPSADDAEADQEGLVPAA